MRSGSIAPSVPLFIDGFHFNWARPGECLTWVQVVPCQRVKRLSNLTAAGEGYAETSPAAVTVPA